jgi:DMSO reductase anchor subunit
VLCGDFLAAKNTVVEIREVVQWQEYATYCYYYSTAVLVFGPVLVFLVPLLNLVLNLVPVLVPVCLAKVKQRQPAIIRPRDEVQTAIQAGEASRPKSGRSHKRF